MPTADDYYAATPEVRRLILSALGRHGRRRAAANWKADTDKSSARALVALTAQRNGLPRPIWGTHQAARNA